MYTAPEKRYGSAPAPAVTVAVPMRLLEVQAPCEACGSGHSSTLGIKPSSPSGSAVDTWARYCWPSSRARLNVKEVCAPALAGSLDAPWASEKGSGEGHPS